MAAFLKHEIGSNVLLLTCVVQERGVGRARGVALYIYIDIVIYVYMCTYLYMYRCMSTWCEGRIHRVLPMDCRLPVQEPQNKGYVGDVHCGGNRGGKSACLWGPRAIARSCGHTPIGFTPFRGFEGKLRGRTGPTFKKTQPSIIYGFPEIGGKLRVSIPTANERLSCSTAALNGLV